MMLKQLILAALGAASLSLGWTDRALADSPWQKMVLFKKIESDPNNAYPLSDTQGPWMIMAVTFTGPEAETHAKELVHELRTIYKVPAYTYKVEFDYRAGTIGRGIDRFGSPLKMKYRTDRAEEIAVLAGNFTAIDDPEAHKILDKLKHAHPECMQQEGAVEARPLTTMLSLQYAKTFATGEKRAKGPLLHAFITTNPLLPKEYFVQKNGLDRFIYDMNKPLKYSLLTCPGKYTVKVATFKGRVVMDQNEIKDIEQGKKKLGGGLVEAAEQAHQLTEALRTKGYPAYEFHDRTSSVVCIGSFESVGTPRPDGKIEINPQVHTIMETFGASKTPIPGQAMPAIGKPKTIDKIPLDVQPLPVEVPKLGIGSRA
jgi:hypothetical protein